jgi:hypothetical protein
MTDRPSRLARPTLLVSSIALAGVLAGCVAAPGASTGPGATTPPTTAPTAGPTAQPTEAPTPAPSASTVPSAAPSTAPSTAACGVGTWATGARDLVLRLTVAGGFVPVGVDLTNVPVISVFGDGTVVTEGVHIMIYPGPLVPTLQAQVLTEPGMRKLLDAAAAAGLLVKDVTYDSHGIADAPTSFFTLAADGCTHHVNAYALSESNSTTGLDTATIEARRKLLDFANALVDLPTLVGAENIRDAGVYAPTAYRIASRIEAAGPSAVASASTQPVVAWPLKTPLRTFGEPLSAGITDTRCGTVDGSDAAALSPLFAQANTETHWSSAGTQFYLMVRPLLADESGCGNDPTTY